MKNFLSVLLIGIVALSMNAQSKERLFSFRSFNPVFSEMKNFANHGINTVAIFPANTCNSRGDPYAKYPPNWLGENRYDFTIVDRQMDDVLKANPNANFIFIVDLNSPIWLSRRMALLGHSIEGDSFTCLSNALANPLWQKATQNYMKALLGHVEKKYGNKIKAYLFACGMTDEWMDYSSYSAGRFKIQKWKEWLKANGESPRSVPALERFTSASFENLLRDPSKEGDLIKFVEFNSDLVASSISNFAKIARENISADKQIGVFFGYIMELTGGRLVSAGHLSYEKVFADKNIDFLQSPATYYSRPIGEGSGFMCADGTRKRFGKCWLHEIDHFTFMCDPKINKNIPITGFPGDNNRWKTEADSCAGLKREMSLVIVNNASMWFFDMVGDWFNSPEMMKAIERGHEIWEAQQGKEHKSVAEIALIADPQSAMYLNDFRSDKMALIYPKARNLLSRVGAPFEVFSFNDIGHVDMSQYKFFVFPASFKIDEKRKAILEKHVFKKGKASLFMYAPAITDGKVLDAKRVKDFVGVDYGKKGLNITDKNGHSLAYLHDYKELNTDLLRSLAEKVRVKMIADSGVVVYGNEKFIAVHATKIGKTLIKLPFKCEKVVEAFTKKVVAENADSFIYDFPQPDTALFEMTRE